MTIKPAALTAEEWAIRLKGEYSGERRIGVAVLGLGYDDETWEVGITYDGGWVAEYARGYERHALAALALYGQPFGFAREDLAAIEECLKYSPVKLALVWAKIEALLPPEG